jgi:hypothetical protein
VEGRARGKNPPVVVNVVIESPLGSRIKYAATEEHGAMVVSKLLAFTFAYPANTVLRLRPRGRSRNVITSASLGLGRTKQSYASSS